MKTNKHISLEEVVGKKLPFSVPENYFDQFAFQMEQQIGYTHKPVHRFIRPWMYAAAVVVGIMVLGPVFYSAYQNQTAVNTENYESYVLSQVDETVLMDYYVDDSAK
ncbi:MAG: hypothetical protein QM800_03505 [Paludibacter sp.]